MADSPRRPLLNPVLRFTQDPKPKGVTGGGKSADSIVSGRLDEQRNALAQAFREMAATAANQPTFSGQVVTAPSRPVSQWPSRQFGPSVQTSVRPGKNG